MKHFLTLFAAVALLASCAVQQQKNTVRLSEIETSIVAPVVADLDISDVRLSFTYYPSKAELRLKDDSIIIRNAIAQALEENGQADVLVNANYRYNYKGNVMKSVIITGYPAKVKGFTKPTQPCDYYYDHATPYIAR